MILFIDFVQYIFRSETEREQANKKRLRFRRWDIEGNRNYIISQINKRKLNLVRVIFSST